jgi:hypothetical protein
MRNIICYTCLVVDLLTFSFHILFQTRTRLLNCLWNFIDQYEIITCIIIFLEFGDRPSLPTELSMNLSTHVYSSLLYINFNSALANSAVLCSAINEYEVLSYLVSG